MPDVSGPGGSTPTARPHLPPTARLDGLMHETGAEAVLEPEPPEVHRVGWGFISLYTLAFMSTSLLFIAPLLITLALKVNSLVGIKQAPSSLSLVAGIGALLSIFANPFFGKMSGAGASRPSSRGRGASAARVHRARDGSVGALVRSLAGGSGRECCRSSTHRPTLHGVPDRDRRSHGRRGG